MTFTPIFGTGFETGSIYGLFGNYGTTFSCAAGGKTGSYQLAFANYQSTMWTLPATSSEISIGIWIYTATNCNFVSLIFTDGTTAVAQWGNGSVISYYINGVLKGTGSSYILNTWRNLQMHLLIDDVNGIFEAKLDGNTECSFTGDTKPTSATEINRFGLGVWNVHNAPAYYDDLIIGTGGYPGDWRFSKLTPTSDSSTEFSRSTGSTSYTLIDEVPPSSTDYVYASGTGLRDFYGLSDFTNTSASNIFVPSGINYWVYAVKDPANTQKFKHLLRLGSTVYSGTEVTTNTTYTMYPSFHNTDPDGNLWTDTSIDNLEIGIESVI